MASNKLYLKSDCDLGLEALKDSNGDTVTGATVTASVFKGNPFAFGTALNPTQEIQTLTPDAKATAGNFKLGYRGNWTSNIAYNAALATIQTDIQALTGIGSGNVIVTGFQLSDNGFAGGMIFTFANTFGQAFMLEFDFSGITGPTQNGSVITENTAGIMRGEAIDLTGGKVGLPVSNMVDIYTDAFVQIVGTRNYDGQYTIDAALSTKGRLVITATYVFEDFTGAEQVYFGCPNGNDISLTSDSLGNYYGNLPANLSGLVKGIVASVFYTVTAGGFTTIIQAMPTAGFNGTI